MAGVVDGFVFSPLWYVVMKVDSSFISHFSFFFLFSFCLYNWHSRYNQFNSRRSDNERFQCVLRIDTFFFRFVFSCYLRWWPYLYRVWTGPLCPLECRCVLCVLTIHNTWWNGSVSSNCWPRLTHAIFLLFIFHFSLVKVWLLFTLCRFE